MGLITRFDLNRIIQEYHTPYFFETGTFKGDGVEYALKAPFKKIISVEIIPDIADEAKIKFAPQKKVKILENNSASALEEELHKLGDNCLFWLDAHFPGADAGMKPWNEGDETLRLPLIKEVEIISRRSKHFQDVLIIDDLRIYKDGPYEHGNVPADALPKTGRNIRFIYKYFGSTHVILKSYLDEGYVLLFPKKKYRNHFSFSDLFRKKYYRGDFYLNPTNP